MKVKIKMKRDIKRMADERKIIVCIQRRKGERKGGGVKEGRQEKSREARKELE